MRFLRHLLGITKLEKEKNQCIRQKTGAQNIAKEIKQYKEKWLQHVQRMDTNRLPKQALQYKPKGRRNIGRPRKRWRDQLHLEDQGTENMPNPSGTWWWWWWWWLWSWYKEFVCYETTSSLSPLAFLILYKLLKSWALKQTLNNKGESFPTFRSIMLSSSEPNRPKRIDFSIVVAENWWSSTFAPRVFCRGVHRDEFASPFFLFYRQ